MYEIWLVLNIVWEIALSVWPLVLATGVVWAVLMGTAWSRPTVRWGAGLPLALLVGLVVCVAAVLLVPGWSRSSMTEMGYWVDWANLLAVAAGFGAVAAALAWPLLAMRHGSARH
jgi:undecaprenyl pyrophosphate phosphatase UppP